MSCPSLTTKNDEISRKPHLSSGLRRHRPGFVVAAPRRWGDIDFVTPPRIRTDGARNRRYRGFPAGPLGARPLGVNE